MFIVTKEKVCWADIEWNTLNEDGETVTEAIRMKLDLVPADEYDEFFKDFAGEGAEGFDDREFIRKVSRDWDGVVGEDRKPFTFDADNLDIVMQTPGFLLGWKLSYIKAWHGQGKVREKNSDASPADGQAGGKRKR